MSKPRLLLHSCCAPCAGYPIKLLGADYEIKLVFYGPNIHPEEEYNKRLESVFKLINKINVDMVELEYDRENWIHLVKGLEKEPEGGKRCSMCHRIRLKRIAKYAKENRFDAFTTTLTVSPHKSTESINIIGNEIGNDMKISFLNKNFKENDGFKKSCDLAKSYDLYRQRYCGCIYSLN